MLTYLQEAEAMASAISDSRRLRLVSIHTAEYFRQTGRFAEARTLAEQALAMGDKLQDRPAPALRRAITLGSPATPSATTGAHPRCCGPSCRSPQAEWRTGAYGGTMIGSWAAYPGDQPRLARALSRGARGVRRGASTPAAGRWPSPKGSAAHTAWRAACIGLGYVSLVRGDLDAAGPVLERACSVAREANLTLLRPQATPAPGRRLPPGRADRRGRRPRCERPRRRSSPDGS